ncbi:hypothetical protein GmHk_13G036277 [Glycine max]|nr:hypothetical protein GmHk_13G036277 [Glycine max]KAH1215034.1 hypothetical protein GmHk_13G036277 [Glycine max]
MNNDKCTRRNEVDWHQEIEIKKKDTMRKVQRQRRYKNCCGILCLTRFFFVKTTRFANYFNLQIKDTFRPSLTHCPNLALSPLLFWYLHEPHPLAHVPPPRRRVVHVASAKFEVRHSLLLAVLLRFTKDPFSQVRASALEGLVGFYKCGRVERHHVLVGKTLVSRTQGTKVMLNSFTRELNLLIRKLS